MINGNLDNGWETTKIKLIWMLNIKLNSVIKKMLLILVYDIYIYLFLLFFLVSSPNIQ